MNIQLFGLARIVSWASKPNVSTDSGSIPRPSKRCHVCGYVSPKLPLRVRRWTCSACRTDHDRDRDLNAAHNVLAAGLAVLAHGETVRPECMSVDAQWLGSVKWESLSL
ncbi:zinc ribbon domain-containing protein [Bordetella tumulicola]|uniref:zinc ribbon domain-containing protein n=1 Tax=Bordetella tumulicola TaxID=1649133 RepID=UPI0039EF55EF